MAEENPTVELAPVSEFDNDPFVQYSRALHDYTLRLWAESRRQSEERYRQQMAAQAPAASTSRTQSHQHHQQSHSQTGQPSHALPDNQGR